MGWDAAALRAMGDMTDSSARSVVKIVLEIVMAIGKPFRCTLDPRQPFLPTAFAKDEHQIARSGIDPISCPCPTGLPSSITAGQRPLRSAGGCWVGHISVHRDGPTSVCSTGMRHQQLAVARRSDQISPNCCRNARSLISVAPAIQIGLVEASLVGTLLLVRSAVYSSSSLTRTARSSSRLSANASNSTNNPTVMEAAYGMNFVQLITLKSSIPWGLVHRCASDREPCPPRLPFPWVPPIRIQAS